MWPPYVVVDDFLDKEHLRKLSEIPFQTSGAEWEMLTHTIRDDGSIEQSFQSSINRTDAPHFSEQDSLDIYNAHRQFMLDTLEKLNPERAKQLIKYTELNIVMTGKDFIWPIHNDSRSKMLSGVIYISPEENEGTWLYETQLGGDPRQINWKPNRAFIFSRNSKTWHSYRADGKNNRLTLVYNIIGHKDENK